MENMIPYTIESQDSSPVQQEVRRHIQSYQEFVEQYMERWDREYIDLPRLYDVYIQSATLQS